MRVINDILDFSKIEAGKLEVLDEDFSLKDTLLDACAIVGVKAREKGLELSVSVDGAVPEVIRGDSNRIRQVLLNLLGNAVKFTSHGRVLARAALEGARDEGEHLRVEVSDTGIGLDAEVRKRLFQPFSQGDPTTTREYGGSGLGLSIAKHLVELMGGEIGVQSVPGEGSTFWFSIPCRIGTAVEPGRPVRDMTGARMLVVDDRESSGRTLERRLAQWGINPGSAGGSAAALHVMQEAVDAGHPFEAALIDVEHPVIHGLGLARVIKASPKLRSTRLILFSAEHVPSRDARLAGVDVVLSSPVDESSLHAELVRALTRAAPPTQFAVSDSVPATAPTVTPGRVLVAEDNEINQIAARRVLQKLGFAVDIADNGRAAIEMSARTDYAAVLMDCQMPGVDGYTAAAEIRRREGDGRRTPIIAMTAHTMEGDREKCLAAGMDDYIPKPLRLAEFKRVLGSIIPGVPADQPPSSDPDAQPPTVIDYAVLEEILADGGREEGIAELFLRSSHDRLLALTEAIDADDAARTAAVAHSLKGSCATFGAMRMTQLAGRLSGLEGEVLLSEARAVRDSLSEALALTKSAIEQALAA
jgi:two-component system, sensor histidine kinase and response regulator